MKHKLQRIAATAIACCLSVPGFSQSATLKDASENPAAHKALQQKIAGDKQEVVRYRVGHVIVGRIQLEGADDPETVRSQMIIEADGFFSDAIRDLDRPIAFRKSGYRLLDFSIPAGTTPDETGVIDVGTIRMEKAGPSEFRKASGTVSMQDKGDPSAAHVTLHLSAGRANTPHNGTEGVRKSDPPVEATVDKTGVVTATGLTEGEYYVTFRSDGFVSQAKSYQVSSNRDLDLGSIRLEKPLEISVEYIVAMNPETAFDEDSVKDVTFPAGTKWKSVPMNEWDLEFVQTAGTVTFNYSYAPCTLADLGEGKLADFVKIDFSTAKLDPRQVPFRSGHVYLLNHQRSLKHVVLFRVEVQEPSDRSDTGGNTDDDNVAQGRNKGTVAASQDSDDKELRALLEARRDVLKSLVNAATAHLEAREQPDPISIVRVLEFKQNLLQAELELATSKKERIAIIEPALKSIMQFEKIVEDRLESTEATHFAKAARIQIEIELHKARKGP